MKIDFLNVNNSLILLIFFIMGCQGIPVTEKINKQNLFKGKTVFVYPVHLLTASSSFDTTLAHQVANFVETIPDMHVKVIQSIPSVNSEWSMNEAKMFIQSFSAFSESSKSDSDLVEYGLLVEVLLQPNSVVGVHYYILYNKDGKAVIGHIINSHDTNFKSINPKTSEEGIQVFKKVFAQDMINLRNGN